MLYLFREIWSTNKWWLSFYSGKERESKLQLAYNICIVKLSVIYVKAQDESDLRKTLGQSGKVLLLSGKLVSTGGIKTVPFLLIIESVY